MGQKSFNFLKAKSLTGRWTPCAQLPVQCTEAMGTLRYFLLSRKVTTPITLSQFPEQIWQISKLNAQRQGGTEKRHDTLCKSWTAEVVPSPTICRHSSAVPTASTAGYRGTDTLSLHFMSEPTRNLTFPYQVNFQLPLALAVPLNSPSKSAHIHRQVGFSTQNWIQLFLTKSPAPEAG